MNSVCTTCHKGPNFSDEEFHNVVLAQLGPGQGNGQGEDDDFGRFNVNGVASHQYAFRTAPLRNVELTAPYGHAGQYVKLEDFVDHYSESHEKLANFATDQLDNIDPLLRSSLITSNFDDILATRTSIIRLLVLTKAEIEGFTDFLRLLTDAAARDLSHVIPTRVPSGLPIDR